MNYKFPVITHLDQIRAAIEGRPEFAIHDKGDYFVADYAVNFEDSFPPVVDERTALLRECRGIMFDKEGKLISRPFCKFFNVNEKEETQAHTVAQSDDWARGRFVVLDKMDGSFLRPVGIGGSIKLCTKHGVTEQALMAEKFVGDQHNYRQLFLDLVAFNMTGLFEFCSRENQIVLDYPEPTLMLIAIRNNTSGTFVPYDMMYNIAVAYNVPVVDSIKEYMSLPMDDLIAKVKSSEVTEGVVIRFDNGHMMKLKADWYCNRHRAKDSILLEKNLIDLHLNGKLDDILPLLDDNFRVRVEDYVRDVGMGIKNTVWAVEQVVEQVAGLPRKDQALNINDRIYPIYRPVIFAALDGKPIHKFVVDLILKNTSSITRLNDVRSLFNAVWA